MPASVTMNDRQHVAAGITLIDLDGKPYAALPPGVTASFTSSDATVADFVLGPDGMNGDVTSGNVGSCIITGTITFADGSPSLSDTLAVAVQNSAPGSANFNVGTPVDET